jgi:hypothetical protein
MVAKKNPEKISATGSANRVLNVKLTPQEAKALTLAARQKAKESQQLKRLEHLYESYKKIREASSDGLNHILVSVGPNEQEAKTARACLLAEDQNWITEIQFDPETKTWSIRIEWSLN